MTRTLAIPSLKNFIAISTRKYPNSLGNTLAYSLHGNPTKIAGVLYGERDCGKTTVMQAAAAALGYDYMKVLPVGALEPAKTGSGNNATPSQEMVMPPTRIAYTPEMENSIIDAARFKALSGSDAQVWRPLYMSPRMQRPTAVPWLVGNDAPRGAMYLLSDPAVQSRLKPIEYQMVPEEAREKHMVKGFENASNPDSIKRRQALTNDLVRRAITYNLDNPPQTPDVIERARIAFIEDAVGELGVFIRDGFVRDPHEQVTYNDIWRAAKKRDGKESVSEVKTIFGVTRNVMIKQFKQHWGLGASVSLRDSDGVVCKGFKGIRCKQEDEVKQEMDNEMFVDINEHLNANLLVEDDEYYADEVTQEWH